MARCRLRILDCQANLTGVLYGLEPTGDQTFLSVKTPGSVMEIKTDRDFRQALDSDIGITFDRSRLYYFNSMSGERIAA